MKKNYIIKELIYICFKNFEFEIHNDYILESFIQNDFNICLNFKISKTASKFTLIQNIPSFKISFEKISYLGLVDLELVNINNIDLNLISFSPNDDINKFNITDLYEDIEGYNMLFLVNNKQAFKINAENSVLEITNFI